MNTLTSRRAPRRLAVIGIVGVLTLAACGEDEDAADGTTAPTAAGSPTTEAAAPTTTAAAVDTTAGGGLYGSEPGGTSAAPTTGTTGGSAPAGGETVSTGETSIGTVLVNADGLTLYGFLPDADAAGEPTCTADCAGAWPPAFVEGEPTIGGDLDPAVFSVVEHPDGGTMLKAGDWPLYTFAGDAAPGDVNGQGSGGVWFAVGPDGEMIDAG